jgi:regulatory protein
VASADAAGDGTDTSVGSTTADLQVETESAREAALHALSAKGRSRAELTDLLDQKGFGREAVSDALDRLEAVGLVDDAALARELVSRGASDRAGSALLDILRRRGIDRDLAARVVREAPDQPEAARTLIARRWSSLRALPEHVALRRAQGFLARRGFDPADASSLLDELRHDRS